MVSLGANQSRQGRAPTKLLGETLFPGLFLASRAFSFIFEASSVASSCCGHLALSRVESPSASLFSSTL